MLKIYLIRHGETALEGRYKGQIDIPLAPHGIKTLRKTAGALEKMLGGGPLSAIYSSDLVRTRESARIITRRLGMTEITEEKGLRERAFGEWEGLTFKEIEERWPEVFARWAKDPVKTTPVRGESTRRLRDRSVKTMDGIARRHGDGESIAVVSHSGPIRVLLCHYLGLSISNIFRLDLDFGCINLVYLYGDSPVVKFMNWRPA